MNKVYNFFSSAIKFYSFEVNKKSAGRRGINTAGTSDFIPVITRIYTSVQETMQDFDCDMYSTFKSEWL